MQSGMNHTCVAQVAKRLRQRGLETTHLLSIGGWDAPHPPDSRIDGTEWAESWIKWNANEVALPSLDFAGYDGVDWDLEGSSSSDSLRLCLTRHTRSRKRQAHLKVERLQPPVHGPCWRNVASTQD